MFKVVVFYGEKVRITILCFMLFLCLVCFLCMSYNLFCSVLLFCKTLWSVLMLYTMHANFKKSAKNDCACYAKPHSAAHTVKHLTLNTQLSAYTARLHSRESHSYQPQREREREETRRKEADKIHSTDSFLTQSGGAV